MNSKVEYITKVAEELTKKVNVTYAIESNPMKNQIKVFLFDQDESYYVTLAFSNYWYCHKSQEAEAINIKIQIAEAIGDLIKLHLKGVQIPNEG